jgi:hypothetical protein
MKMSKFEEPTTSYQPFQPTANFLSNQIIPERKNFYIILAD